jgi:hypothetical protein
MSLDGFSEAVERQRQEALSRIGAVPVSVLIWGPNPAATSPVAATRRELRRALEGDGHLVRYSEDLYDSAAPYSLLAQQVADVEAHDITFSLPDSPGSIAEAHDFARIPSISHRIVTFVDGDYNTGYANRTILELQSTATCRVQIYKACDLPRCVIDYARGLVRRLQEFYYLNGRRF